jgi:hypothetical protein
MHPDGKFPIWILTGLKMPVVSEVESLSPYLMLEIFSASPRLCVKIITPALPLNPLMLRPASLILVLQLSNRGDFILYSELFSPHRGIRLVARRSQRKMFRRIAA